MDLLNPRIPLGDWIEDGIDWLTSNLGWLFDFIKLVLTGIYDGLYWVLSTPPYYVIILIFAALAFWIRGWRFALFTALGFYLIRAFNQWNNAMSTISLVIVAVLIALIIAIPLGILAARSDGVSRVLKPILDLMQTMPALVYLVPAITIFSVGVTPGAIATVIFALPPGVRLTELAIRQVDPEVVEAGYAFGSSPGKILRQIQLPLALPTIMAGVNQVIMLSLSMVVLAGMAGSGGLGGQVIASISQLNVSLGMEAGLAVVIIAIFLDRVSNAIGTRSSALEMVKHG
ncbi:ABC transporter permease subunit [Epidermidibacterium keratini]|uniref:ABC transporter permease subunit n=1 Tax=Epidermidibacterium keratini TaxID=1891644 RepID=A0A7L4YNV8_9ACTN|nr:proline/glycine betaine ABC transporter permease [Epidermidibacterium keratini]QHC00758.1 ABC transporter permease subunit [Epidermidibacterium keratini]